MLALEEPGKGEDGEGRKKNGAHSSLGFLGESSFAFSLDGYIYLSGRSWSWSWKWEWEWGFFFSSSSFLFWRNCPPDTFFVGLGRGVDGHRCPSFLSAFYQPNLVAAAILSASRRCYTCTHHRCGQIYLVHLPIFFFSFDFVSFDSGDQISFGQGTVLVPSLEYI